MSAKKKMVEVRERIENQLPKQFDEWDYDVFEQVAKVVGLNLEIGGVPIQSQRHLITSWAGMAAGVNVWAAQMRNHFQKELDRVRKENGSLVDAKDKVIEAKESEAKANLEATGFRAAAHIKDENEKALVIEEFAAN